MQVIHMCYTYENIMQTWKSAQPFEEAPLHVAYVSQSFDPTSQTWRCKGFEYIIKLQLCDKTINLINYGCQPGTRINYSETYHKILLQHAELAHEAVLLSHTRTIMEGWIYPCTTDVAEISHVVYTKYGILLLRENDKLTELSSVNLLP